MNQGNVFQAYRSLLFSIAYWMLGNVIDAEDSVQEAYVRWHQAVETRDYMQVGADPTRSHLHSWRYRPALAPPHSGAAVSTSDSEVLAARCKRRTYL
jgi:hypothetical protein